MIHNWAKGTDGNRATARVIMFDYRKAFDLIEQRFLVTKLIISELDTSVVNWNIDFLSHRSQRVKLAEVCFSEWGSVPSEVSQGTKLGSWLFLVLINELDVDQMTQMQAALWKYVDDTTASQIAGF